MTITEQLAEALEEVSKIERITYEEGNCGQRAMREGPFTALERARKIARRALGAYEASKTTPTPSPLLWCCHVRGPDDVHPAPDYQTALKWSDMINDWSDQANAKFKDGEKVMCKAAPAIWPWSPESHAQNLAKAIADFSPRLPKERAENEYEPAG